MFTSVIHNKNKNKNKRLTNIAAVLLSVALIVGLQGCSSSSSSTPAAPIPNQDPSGLYKSGTGNFGGAAVSDIIAFVHNSRLMAFSVTNNFLIDGTIDSITANDYVATVSVYKDGVLDQASVNVTGMVTNASQISGTLNGTGVGSGDFTVTFDPLYNRGATNARINNDVGNKWGGPMMTLIAGTEVNNFDVDINNNFGYSFFIPTPVTRCSGDGSLTLPDASINVYLVQTTMTQVDATCTISETPDYTGFSAVVDGTSTDDTMIYSVTNGAHSTFGVLTR